MKRLLVQKPYFTQLEEKFKCIFYDQIRGPKVTIQAQLNELHSLVLNTSEKVVLVGHSWGGVLATKYASLHEDKLAGLVLMSTGLNTSQWREEFRAVMRNRVSRPRSLEKLLMELAQI